MLFLITGILGILNISCSKEKSKKYTQQKIFSARMVMDEIEKCSSTYDYGESLRIQFHIDMPYDFKERNNQIELIKAIADADCVLKGKPRLINYYSPGGIHIAQSDPKKGIQFLSDLEKPKPLRQKDDTVFANEETGTPENPSLWAMTDIRGYTVNVGQEAGIVQSRIRADKFVTSEINYGDESKGYYNDRGITYIITYGPPQGGRGGYVVKKIESYK